jgi:hypothetical protein
MMSFSSNWLTGLDARSRDRIGVALVAVLAVWHDSGVRTQDRVIDGNVDVLLARHLAAVDEYRHAFANLVADETLS